MTQSQTTDYDTKRKLHQNADKHRHLHCKQEQLGPKVKNFFMLNLTEHEIYPAHQCYNANNFWHFNIYKHDKYNI